MCTIVFRPVQYILRATGDRSPTRAYTVSTHVLYIELKTINTTTAIELEVVIMLLQGFVTYHCLYTGVIACNLGCILSLHKTVKVTFMHALLARPR